MTYPTARITCPVCGAKITVEIEPGEEAVYYPNSRAHPGSPPQVVDVHGCECWDTMNFFLRQTARGTMPALDWYEETLLDRAGEVHREREVLDRTRER